MIATDRFVHIHLHKSGGTFVNECLLRFFPNARQLGYHLPRSRIPTELAELPVLGFVRNPWSYYVSWYAFQSERPQPNALFRCMSEEGTLGFNVTIRNLLTLGDADGKLETLLPLLPEAYANRGLNLPAFALAPIRDSGLGFYSYLCRYMYGGNSENLFVGRTENLRVDFLAFLQREKISLPVALRDFIEQAPALNTSAHDAYRDYYNDATQRLVAERDRTLIDAFGYRYAI
ncbi:MAG: hypothetical protein M3Y27_05480 [Acidobacteriota bacterium]|nr:hypothetical protein [Acidobacteriota bacterium]